VHFRLNQSRPVQPILYSLISLFIYSA